MAHLPYLALTDGHGTGYLIGMSCLHAVALQTHQWELIKHVCHSRYACTYGYRIPGQELFVLWVAHLWNSRKESRFHVAVMFMLRSAQLAPAALVAMAME